MKTARKKVSITRSQCTSIPKVYSPTPVLYKNKESQHLVWDVFGDDDLLNILGEDWQEEAPMLPGESVRYSLRYSIVGGKDNHCFDVWIEGAEAGKHDIEWIYIRSVMGGQIKMIKPDRDAHVLFAMAEDDAYMFCTNNPCIMCSFGCKLGFEFYAYSKSEGLLKNATQIVYSKQNPHNNPLI